MRTRPVAWAPAEPTEPDTDLAERAAALAELMRGRLAVVLTGAGVSTGSGIPDYRGPQSPQRTPMTYGQFVSDPGFRQRYWARNHVGWRHMEGAEPNRTHGILAEWERAGRVAGVITQNVDMLHLKAGSRNVIDLHGNYGSVTCISCTFAINRWAFDDQLSALNPGFRERVASRGTIEVAPDADALVGDTAGFAFPDCPACGGILKPAIVYFGENVPRTRVAAARALVDGADLVLAVGTSLTVQSGYRFIRQATGSGRPVAIVNRGTTRAHGHATLTIDGDCSEVLALVDAAF